MEADVGGHIEHNLRPIKDLINSLCLRSSISNETDGTCKRRRSDAVHVGLPEADGEGMRRRAQIKVTLVHIEHVLSRFTVYVLRHPKVLQSPDSTQCHLRRELGTFLLAHVAQIKDNTRLSQQDFNTARPPAFASPQTSWVRGTSVDHTSCPYAFAFFACLIAPEPGYVCFATLRQSYPAQDAYKHLTTTCRQYNDHGSVARDRAEKNANSGNFPEFEACKTRNSRA